MPKVETVSPRSVAWSVGRYLNSLQMRSWENGEEGKGVRSREWEMKTEFKLYALFPAPPQYNIDDSWAFFLKMQNIELSIWLEARREKSESHFSFEALRPNSEHLYMNMKS